MDQDNIDHLSVVDIKLDLENAGEKQLFFNEIYSPIFKRSVFQLLHAMSLNDNGTINSFKTTAKAHATIRIQNSPLRRTFTSSFDKMWLAHWQKLERIIHLSSINLRKCLLQ